MKNNARVFPETAFLHIKLHIGQILKETPMQSKAMGRPASISANEGA